MNHLIRHSLLIRGGCKQLNRKNNGRINFGRTWGQIAKIKNTGIDFGFSWAFYSEVPVLWDVTLWKYQRKISHGIKKFWINKSGELNMCHIRLNRCHFGNFVFAKSKNCEPASIPITFRLRARLSFWKLWAGPEKTGCHSLFQIKTINTSGIFWINFLIHLALSGLFFATAPERFLWSFLAEWTWRLSHLQSRTWPLKLK